MQKNLSLKIVTSLLLLSHTLPYPALGQAADPVHPTTVVDASSYSSTGDLRIEAGQNVVIDFSNASSELVISGNLINNGNLYAVSTTPQQSLASFLANNIVNNQGALFTSVLPSGGIFGFSNAIPNLNLSLTAVANVTNLGVISSAADLNVTAGNAITNISNSNYAAAMTAAQNLNMQMASLVNSGMLAAQNNINLASQLNQSLAINSSNGVVSALGNINVINADLISNKLPISVIGGDWIAQNLNLEGGQGFVTAHINSMDGRINASGAGADISNAVGDLILGYVHCSGDPTISSANDLILSPENVPGGTLDVSEFLTLLAGKNIIAAGLTSASTNADGKGNLRSLTMKAGLGIDLASNQMISLSTASNAGAAGDIVLEAANGDIKLGALTIDASSSVAGGNINISAKNGSVLMDGTVIVSSSGLGNAGNISISSDGGGLTGKGTQIDSTSASGFGGTVFLSTGTGSANIELPNVSIDTRSTTGTSGNVLIFTGNANTTGSETGTANVDFTGGQINTGSSGGFSGNVSIGAGFATASSDEISLGSIDTTGANNGFGLVSVNNLFSSLTATTIKTTGAPIFLSSGNELSFSNLDASSSVGSGGLISLSMNSSTPFQPGSMSVDGFDGGTIILSNSGTGGISMSGQSITASSGVGGNLQINASGPINLSGSYALTGFNGGGSLSANSSSSMDISASIDTSSESGTAGTIILGADTINANGALLKSERGTALTSSGGTISVFAGSITGGKLEIRGGVILVDAGSLSNSELVVDTSGQIPSNGNSLLGGAITVATGLGLPSILSLTANGANGGGGGLITLTNVGAGTFDLTGNNISLTSKGIGEGAKGGALTVIANGRLNIASGVFDLSAGTNGQGGAISLTAGANGADGSTLQVNGDLNVAGNGTGDGGSINIALNTADGDLLIGKSGNATRLQAGGNTGGSIAISAGRNLEVFGGRVQVAATGENGSGGTIDLRAGVATNGLLTLQSALHADGNGSGSGGNISLNPNGSADFGDETSVGSLVLNASVTANGGASGKGGNISISAKNLGSNLTFGNATRFVSVRADGGKTSGDGGVIQVTTGGNVDLSRGVLSAQAYTAGHGGKISLDLTANPASLNLGSEGRIVADAGSGQGNGGSVFISSKNNLTLVGGRVSTQSATGSGGNIELTIPGGEGIPHSIESSTVFWANGKAAEDGQIIFRSENNDLSVNSTGVLYGKLSSKAANVSIIANAADRDLNVFEVVATKGNVLIEASGLNADLRTLSGGMVKAAGATSVTGGQITLRAGRDIRILEGSSVISRETEEQNGGNISLSAAGLDTPNVHEGFIRVAGNVDASGKTQGGTITLKSSSELANTLSGVLRSDASQVDGTGGSIIMDNSNKLLNLQVTNTGVISSSPSSTAAPLLITTGSGDINIDFATGATLKAPLNLSGKQIDVFVRGDFRDVSVDGITAQNDANVTVFGPNSSMTITGVVTASNIDLESRHIVNKGSIVGISNSDSVVTLTPRHGDLILENSGSISATSKGIDENLAATVSIGGNGNINVSGGGTLQAKTVKLTSTLATVFTGNQTVIQDQSATSTTSVEANRITVNPNVLFIVKSNIEGAETNLTEIRATNYENNGTISVSGPVSIRLQTDSSASSSMVFDSSGTWIAPLIWFSHLNSLGISNTVRGTVGTVHNKEGGSTTLRFREAVNKVDLNFLGGSIDATWENNIGSSAQTLTANDSFLLKMSETSGASRIAVSKNIFAINNLILKNDSSLGSISIGSNVSLSAGKSVQLSVGTVNSSNHATSAPPNVQVNGTLGNGSKGTILLSPTPNSPLFEGAMSTINLPSGNGKIVIYDGGNSPEEESQIIFHGGNTVSLIPISYTEQVVSTNTAFRESALSGMKFWYFEKPEFDKSADGNFTLRKGQLVFEALEDISFGLGPAHVLAKKGAIVSVERGKKGLLVRNIADQRRNSVLVRLGLSEHELMPGWQLSLGSAVEEIPTRNESAVQTSYGRLCVSEYSLSALLGSDLLQAFRHADCDYLKKKTSWIEKSAACIGMLRAKQGPFSTK